MTLPGQRIEQEARPVDAGAGAGGEGVSRGAAGDFRGAASPGTGPRERAAAARASLALALVLLHADDLVSAVRAALGALATCRALEDARGEAASLHMLASCFRALGRDADAARIDGARKLSE